MTKETLEKAKLIDENIYYIKNLLKVLNQKGLYITSIVSGDQFKLNSLDSFTHDKIIEDMIHTLNVRMEEMINMLEDL